jgi:Protein of unknown function (DUF3054)
VRTIGSVRILQLGHFTALLSDVVALLVFVTIGLLTHHGDLTWGGYARDAIPIVGCWLLAAGAFDLYKRPRPSAFIATWLVGVTAGVIVRSIVRLHLDGGDGVFLLVALGFTLLFVVVARRLAADLTPRLRRR